MASFLIAYLTLWLGVAAYVVRLGAEHRRLRQSFDALQGQLAAPAGPEQPVAKAA